ncbi:ribonuclease E/G [Acetobacter orientalis]|uniref:ribonuclease E/G n=1 Tax=Acetobacter orientalis TaxID=146474 RepID=UPI0039ED3C04
MSVFLRLTFSPGEVRIAVTQDDKLLDYALWRPAAPDGVGDVYWARIATLAHSMGGAFIDLGTGEQGFLPLSSDVTTHTEGQCLAVQVTRAAQGGKGLRLRKLDTPPSPTPDKPGLLSRGPTPLARLAHIFADAALVADSPESAALIPPALQPRRSKGFRPWPEGIAHACAALEEPIVTLPGGMQASITPTPALIAIDMDAPPTTTGWSKQTAQFAANRDALPALLHQIRLRNLSGAILIDPAGLAVRKRQALLEPVKAMLQADPLKPRCLGITGLGLIEMVRARIHPSLPELLNGPHGRALAALRTVLARHPTATQLRCGLALLGALEADPQAVADCMRLRGKPFTLKLDPSLPALAWIPQSND